MDRTTKFFGILTLLLALLFSVPAVAQEHEATSVEQHTGAFSGVLASGVTPLLDEALETEGEVTDPEGNATKARMTFVPFVVPDTGKRGYFMRVSVSSIDGEPLFDHEYTVYNDEYDFLEAPIQSDSPATLKSLSLASDVAKVAGWIRTKKWSSVQSWITTQVRKGVAKALIGQVVKLAFQKAGYWCPDLPWWIPQKFYIYLLTCARVAG